MAEPLPVEPSAGDTRSASEWATCSGEPCDDAAALDVLHCTDDGSRVWIPLCQEHYDHTPSYGLDYIVEIHGFIRPRAFAERKG
jgi:hypothetical protein